MEEMNIAQKRLVAAIVAMHPELCMGDKKQEELYLAMHDLTSKMAKLNKCGGECLNEDSGLHLQDVSQQSELLNDFLVKLRRLLKFTHSKPLPKYVEYYEEGKL